MYPILGLIVLCITSSKVTCQEVEPVVFSPIVTATCRAGVMTIKVETLNNFVGVVQSRDHRKPECSGYGENTKVTFLRVNMVADVKDRNYCGVFFHETTDEYSVAVAVRVHRTLETAKDKFYMITCGKAGFQNTRNETSLVNLELLGNEDERVQQVIYGRDYKLRAHFSKPDGKYGMKVKRCFSFSDTNNTVELVDDRGCPDTNIMSDFKYNDVKGIAEATLFSMFKFPESNRVHFQCDILVCKGPCKEINCDDSIPEARSLTDPQADALLQQPEDGALMASYSVFVLEPGEKVDASPVCTDCSVTSQWVFWLCLAFGFGFFVLLIIIVFLLSAVTCSCVSSEVDKERQKKELDSEGQQQQLEFDPYAKSWHGSQYGSRFHLNTMSSRQHPASLSHNTYATNSTSLRYSLTGELKPMPVPYLPAPSVMSAPPRPRSRSRSRPRSRSRSRPRSGVQNIHSNSSTESSTQLSTGRLVRK